MPTFFYQGKTRDGQRQSGHLVARDENEAVRTLRRQQILVTRLRVKSPRTLTGVRAWGWPRISGRDLVVVTLQLSTMIKAGIALAPCLHILSTHSENPQVRQILTEVRQDVETGQSLADALRAHPRVFPVSYVSMIEAGEAGGMLDVVLPRLATHLENMGQLRNQIKMALAYPAVLVVVAGVMLTVLVMWGIPLFGAMFSDLGGALPWPTVLVMESSYFLKANALLFPVVGLGAWLGGRFIYGTTWGRQFVDHMILRLPILGDILKKVVVVRISRTLGSLLRSGVPILDSLAIAAGTTNNVAVQEAVQQARISIREGETVSEPLARSGIFPSMVTQMIAVGEASGSLDVMLEKVGDLYDQEVKQGLATVTALIEPGVLLILGIAIGFIVVAMYLPMFTMASLM